MGLVVEIIKELREFGEVGASAGGVVGAALALLLFVAFLIHQVGELTSISSGADRRAATGEVDNERGVPFPSVTVRTPVALIRRTIGSVGLSVSSRARPLLRRRRP
jgi:hypothetical protein